MPRTPRKKETKNPIINEEVKEPEPQQPEPIVEIEQVKDAEQDAEAVADEKIELDIPKKRPRQRTEKQLEQLRIAREKSLANKELRRKQKEEEEQALKKELEIKIQAEKKALEQKIVKKALSIKKKEIKKQEILDEISDDETPIEKIKIPPKKESNLKVKTSKTLYFD